MNQTMLFMMPLMFAFFTLQFPSGLALYWVSTNVISIVLQYFYMGRKMNWRQIFTISPAPAPAVQKPQERGPKPSSKPSEPEESDSEADVIDEAPRRRRRRRGRRRR
jgi:YidC/Oxa1 family membrane protein insertase